MQRVCWGGEGVDRVVPCRQHRRETTSEECFDRLDVLLYTLNGERRVTSQFKNAVFTDHSGSALPHDNPRFVGGNLTVDRRVIPLSITGSG